MTFYHVMGFMATISLLFPIILILVFKLTGYKSFPALLAYYIILAGYNILKMGYFSPGAVGDYYIITSNLLNAPLMFLFLTHFSTTPGHKKKLHILALSYLIYEIITVASFGYTMEASAVAMGPGLLILVGFSLVLFIRHTKTTIIHHHKALGKALLSTALLFAYLGYSFIYVFLYIMDTQFKNDTYLIYFFIVILSSLLMSVGIYVESKRIQQLEELRTTREELKKLYGDEAETKKATPTEEAVFNFDNEKWN